MDSPVHEPMRQTRKAFEQIGRMKAPARPLFERFFDRLLPALPDSQKMDWGDEADWARLQQEPLRARWLLRIVFVVVLLLLAWAGFAQIDEVTRGGGKVVSSKQVQKIQAVDPGQVKEILVREGQEVGAGQLLLRIDPSRYLSVVGAADARRLSLMAKEARLQALLDGSAFIVPEEVVSSAPGIAAEEREHYRSSFDEAEYQLSIVREQFTQREQELREVEASHTQAVNSLKLAREDLEKTEPLLVTGAVSEVEVNNLRLKVEEFDGKRKQDVERIRRSQAAIVEAKSKIRETELKNQNQWRSDLLTASAQLKAVTAEAGEGKDKVKQADVRSNMRGIVQRLHVNTVGGFVSQGKDLVEIVPLDDKLVIEAKVKQKDIGFLRKGMPARVKITAYDSAIYGMLDGSVEYISADAIMDDPNERNNIYFLIRVQTEKSSFGDKNPITPGMAAEVDVLTGRKSVLSYLLKPVLRAKENAMTER